MVIYYGGDIITMAGCFLEYEEAVVTAGKKIVFTGPMSEAVKKYGNGAKMHNLHGKTMMPGFVEPHAHSLLSAIMLSNDIIAPYDWVLPDTVKKGVQGE